MSRDQQCIEDMLNAAQEILSFTVDMNYASLEADRLTQVMALLKPLLST
ncbi:MAG: hypothetical protein SFY66_04870 [Oculatellaceae cyanobacterium bins.114]|nr:hypothetical protein [Oculatellaceae cyanobacterium bins.114]